MIALLGATGYIGQAFAGELRRSGRPFTALSRAQLDYTRFALLLEFLRTCKPSFLINAAGYTSKPNVDGCETAKADTLQGNTLFPAMLAHACAMTETPWGNVSSGCIYSGAKVVRGGVEQVELDLMRSELQNLYLKAPEQFHGFTETDPPNFSFRSPPCSFYSGTKALAEEAIQNVGQVYLWRLRIPFDEIDNSRNFLSKIQRYAKAYDNINSISHRSDFVRSCLGLWERRAPFGIYNMTNPGAVTTRQVVAMIQRVLKPGRRFDFWEGDEEFYRKGAQTPRSNCILDSAKLSAAGVPMRPVEEALEDSLANWRPEAV